MTLVVLILLGLYLFMVTFSAILGHFSGKIITRRNLLMTLFMVSVIIAFVYIYVVLEKGAGIYGVAGGLFGLSGIALSNGFHMNQRPNLKHHTIRMGVNIFFLILLYLVRK